MLSTTPHSQSSLTSILNSFLLFFLVVFFYCYRLLSGIAIEIGNQFSAPIVIILCNTFASSTFFVNVRSNYVAVTCNGFSSVHVLFFVEFIRLTLLIHQLLFSECLISLVAEKPYEKERIQKFVGLDF